MKVNVWYFQIASTPKREENSFPTLSSVIGSEPKPFEKWVRNYGIKSQKTPNNELGTNSNKLMQIADLVV